MSDPMRITDWDDANLRITRPTQPAPASAPSRSIRDEGDRLLAYLDDLGRPATPERATWARVWTKDGRKLVRLEPRQ